MSLLLTFMELDKLNESTMSRQDLISNIKASGRNYNFSNKSTDQLFRIWELIQKKDNEKAGMKDYYDELRKNKSRKCSNCSATLSDGGTCPVCYNGEEHLYEWLDKDGNTIALSNKPVHQQSSVQPMPPAHSAGSQVKKSNIVTIVYDTRAHRLRAKANDGVHGYANVAFPNNLRTRDGQQYEVDTLIWNGKNYRVSGNIKAI